MFSSMSDWQLARLAEAAVVETFAAGQAIIKEGDIGESMYFITAGQAVVTQQLPARHEGEASFTKHCGIKKVGEYFGEAALSRPVRDFSSGQQLRIAISLALARRPRLLLCDEPTNHLDVTGLLWLEDALREAVDAGDVDALIAVSHDRAFLEGTCTHVLDASGGGANLYGGTYSTYLRTRQLRAEALGQREEPAAGNTGDTAAMVQPAALLTTETS